MLSRLPDFVQIVRGFFMTEKKAALLREDVVKKLVDSHPSRLPPGESVAFWGFVLTQNYNITKSGSDWNNFMFPWMTNIMSLPNR